MNSRGQYNPAVRVRKDRADREATVGALRDRLKRGDKSLIGNKGYRKFLKTAGKRFEIDEEKVCREARLMESGFCRAMRS